MIIFGIITGLLLGALHFLEVYAELKNLKWQKQNYVFVVNLIIYILMRGFLIFADYHDLKGASAAILLAFLFKKICFQIIDRYCVKTNN